MPWTKDFTVDLPGLHQHTITHSIRAIALDETDDIVVLVDTANNIAVNLHQVVEVVTRHHGKPRQALVTGFRIPKKPKNNSKFIRIQYLDTHKTSHVSMGSLRLGVITRLQKKACLLPNTPKNHK